MGMFSTLIKGGVAAAVVRQARKPENQARAKRAFGSLREKVSGGKASPPRR